jgi:hypothetical protein
MKMPDFETARAREWENLHGVGTDNLAIDTPGDLESSGALADSGGPGDDEDTRAPGGRGRRSGAANLAAMPMPMLMPMAMEEGEEGGGGGGRRAGGDGDEARHDDLLQSSSLLAFLFFVFSLLRSRVKSGQFSGQSIL